VPQPNFFKSHQASRSVRGHWAVLDQGNPGIFETLHNINGCGSREKGVDDSANMASLDVDFFLPIDSGDDSFSNSEEKLPLRDNAK
jgi:hypothetical protein